jgi:hypothetical protein
MKTLKFSIILIFIVLGYIQEGLSQNIEELILLFPQQLIPVERDTTVIRKAIPKYKNNEPFDINSRFYVLDIKNGYAEYWVCCDIVTTVCYWNKSNGDKIIAVSEYSCGPVCSSSLTFYLFNPKTKEIKDVGLFPYIVSNEEFFDFERMKKENTPEKYKALEGESYLTESIKLPQKGKNIRYCFYPGCLDGGCEGIRVKEKYKKIIGYEMIWNDGTFNVGNPIMAEDDYGDMFEQ